ncbi:MAG TPA: Rieske 2Fe-2S domain-containing protein [Acidimicrobiales bacterium]|nr:Rieske 2Fe-2S domain-containing protein [Acidimicrobiales bacterium]
MSQRYPFPVPFGWFCVGYPEDFPAGAPKPLYYFARHLVAWRDEAQDLHVQDAFCPHLGAHLGHGGTVDGCEIVCPFHGWQFDAEGANTAIPYSERLNRKARLHTYPTVERNGVSFVWYHPDDAPPMWEVPEFPEMSGDPEWSTVIRTEHTIDASVQEMAENAVDSAHFRFVHNTATVPELEEYTTGFPEAVMRSSQKFPTPRGVMEGKIDTHAWGPGLSLVNFAGIVDTLNLAVTTPIEADRCIVRFNFRFKTMGDEKTTRNVGRAFVAEVDKQVREDKPIWEHKAHLVRPALADNDGPFMKFRKWAAQFYAEPVSDDRLVYPPPFWADRVDEAPAKATASARYTGGGDDAAGGG